MLIINYIHFNMYLNKHEHLMKLRITYFKKLIFIFRIIDKAAENNKL